MTQRQFNAKKFENVNEIDTFLGKKNLSLKKPPHPDGFKDEFIKCKE